jgi:hypothetical protein
MLKLTDGAVLELEELWDEELALDEEDVVFVDLVEVFCVSVAVFFVSVAVLLGSSV